MFEAGNAAGPGALADHALTPGGLADHGRPPASRGRASRLWQTPFRDVLRASLTVTAFYGVCVMMGVLVAYLNLPQHVLKIKAAAVSLAGLLMAAGYAAALGLFGPQVIFPAPVAFVVEWLPLTVAGPRRTCTGFALSLLWRRHLLACPCCFLAR